MDVELHDEQVEESKDSVLQRDFDASLYGEDAREVWKALWDAGPLLQTRDDLLVATTAQAVEEILHQPNLFSSNPSAGFFGSESGAIPLQIDPPDHVNYRRMLDPLFAPRKMAALEDSVVTLANQLIDKVIEQGHCDFSQDFAVPFPSTIFLTSLGLPLQDVEEFLWAKEGMIRPKGADAEARRAYQETTSVWIFAYFQGALEQRRGDRREDILSYLCGLEDAGRLTRDETLNICLLLLAAGLDTVTDTLECAFAFLARHPGHQQQLADDPALMTAAIEELLRYDTPVPSVSRIAMADTVVAGCPVRAGQRVHALLPATNHDPAVYDSPGEVDFRREANRHVAFGAGVHRCLGSHLARLELRVAFREWHHRIPSYRLRQGHEVRFRQGLREIEHLPLEFTPGPRRA